MLDLIPLLFFFSPFFIQLFPHYDPSSSLLLSSAARRSPFFRWECVNRKACTRAYVWELIAECRTA